MKHLLISGYLSKENNRTPDNKFRESVIINSSLPPPKKQSGSFIGVCYDIEVFNMSYVDSSIIDLIKRIP
jgi:hypothetical protein